MRVTPEARRDVAFYLALAVLLAAFVFWQWPMVRQFAWKYDEGLELIKSDLLLQGHQLYREIWSDQPPLFTLVEAGGFVLFGHSVTVGRALVLACGLIGAAALGLLARRLAGRCAALAAVALLLALPHFQSLARTILIGMPAIALGVAALAVLLLAEGGAGHRRGSLIVAGLLFAASLLIKAISAPMLLPAALLVLTGPDWGGGLRRLRWRDALVFGAAVALPVLAALAYYGPAGFAGQIVGTLVSARDSHEFSLAANWQELSAYMFQDKWGLSYLSLLAVGALGLGRLAMARRRRELLLLLLWLGGAFLALMLHIPLRRHEILLLMPPLLAAVASGLQAIGTALWRWRVAGAAQRVVALVGVALVAWCGFTVSAMMREDLASRTEELSFREESPDRQLALEMIAAETAPGEVILTDDPMLAFKSGRAIPPTLAVPSYRRVEAGELTPDTLIALTQAANPGIILFWESRFARVAGYDEWVRAHYALGHVFEDGQRAYVRLDDAAMQAQPAATEEGIALVGSAVPQLKVEPGGALTVDVYLYVEQTPVADYTLFVHLLDGAGQLLGQQDLRPLAGLYDPTKWVAGETLRQQVTIDVPEGATPGEAMLMMGLYGEGQSRLDWVDGQGAELGNQIQLTPRPVVRWRAETAAPAMAQAQEAELGAVAALRGHDSAWVSGDNGRELRLTLYWQCLGETATDYTVFVHLTDSQGNLVAQLDQRPGGGSRPTTGWIAGEYIRDEYVLAVPAEAGEGPFTVGVGMYELSTGARLPAVVAGQAQPDDQVILDPGTAANP